MSVDERVRMLRDAAPNSWIALSGDEARFVAGGTTYAEAVERARVKGENDPVLIKTPDSWAPLVFVHCV